jgi:hypothetical protein
MCPVVLTLQFTNFIDHDGDTKIFSEYRTVEMPVGIEDGFLKVVLKI